MAKEKLIKNIKITDSKEFFEKFEEIKNYLGLENDAEVVRFLVTAYHRELQKQKIKETPNTPLNLPEFVLEP
ncbi:MAG: hypothetical protein QFX36_04095 [Archaeoglobales archaeon]|nr:hypothetical protein [Archaeoglobales archaeon]